MITRLTLKNGEWIDVSVTPEDGERAADLDAAAKLYTRAMSGEDVEINGIAPCQAKVKKRGSCESGGLVVAKGRKRTLAALYSTGTSNITHPSRMAPG